MGPNVQNGIGCKQYGGVLMRRGFFTILFVGLILLAAGCRQSESAAASEREQIASAGSFDTGSLFLLERMDLPLGADGEAAVALYTSAQVASDGQMDWDTGDQWTLLVQQEDQSFVLFDEYVQYGEVQFWVSDLNLDRSRVRKPQTWNVTSM